MTLYSRCIALGLALSAVAGCSSFLDSPSVTDDPNNVTDVTRPGPLYVGVQTAQSIQFEGQLARSAMMYVQQVSGNSRQQIGYDRGGIAPVDLDTYFSSVYASSRSSTGGGGLLDIHKMQSLARSVSDSIYIGIGKVYEALVIGMAADIWGAIPYSQAAQGAANETPAFDTQVSVYNQVLVQLDSAINVFLAVTPGGTNAGPPSDGSELVYIDRGGNSTALQQVYLEVAHSLKARTYMHLAELNPANYALALAEAQQGISTPLNDMLWFHDPSATGQNVWWQFQNTRADIAPNEAIISILQRRINAGIEDSARINFYFVQAVSVDTITNVTGNVGFYGFRPAGTDSIPTVGPPGTFTGNGSPPGVLGPDDPGGAYSNFNEMLNPNISTAGDFRAPIITYAETQLIAAEAAFNAGGQGAAQPYLDATRANRTYGSENGVPVIFPPLASVPATLQNIIEEKYVSLYLNMEVWNDYKRTCLPSLAPAPLAGTNVPASTPIPGRLPYGLTEINANPNTPNVPPTGYNQNDPTPCPVLNYTNSVPLAN